MKRMAIHLIAAARPNFMKVAPLYHALHDVEWCTPVVVHTGQHYDANMSDTFLEDLGLPGPDIHLGVGAGTHAEQTAGVMLGYERLCLERRPGCVIVVGDVNSTMACALTAKKLCIPVAHLEAGLRSRDHTMPEEINRIVTDAISDLLWTPSADANENLRREGIPEERILRVGNIMIDSYEMLKHRIDREAMPQRLGLKNRRYGAVTLHRPANVDNEERLSRLVSSLLEISQALPLVFPVHPRTRARLETFRLVEKLEMAPSVHVLEPLGYVQFMSLVKEAGVVITDSGGIQEETTYLNIPCLTMRENTERPITILQGTNRLVTPETLQAAVNRILSGEQRQSKRPELWDGRTAERVVKSLEVWRGSRSQA